MLAVVALMRLAGGPMRISAGQRWTVVVALVLANTVALHANIRRYVTGVGETSYNLDRNVAWWWHIALGPMGLWVLGSVAFCVAVVVLTRELVATLPAAIAATARDTRSTESADPGAGTALAVAVRS
jgi:hypothetical protein